MATGSGQPARDQTDRDTALPPLLVRIRARMRRRFVAAALLGILLILAPVVPGMVPGVAFGWLRAYAIALFVGILACVAAAVAAMLADARRLAEASAADDRLCPGCGYDPGPAAGAPACPECGVAYERAAVRRQWAVARRGQAGEMDSVGDDEPPA